MEICITPLLRKDISMLSECWCSLIKRENDCLTRNFPIPLFPPLLAQNPQGDQLQWPYICQWLSFVTLLLQQIILDCTVISSTTLIGTSPTDTSAGVLCFSTIQ